MKPFAVIRYCEEKLYEFGYRRALGRGEDGTTYLQYGDAVPADVVLKHDQTLFWFNSEVEAKKFLETIQGNFPQNMYVLLQSKCVSYCEPGPAIVANFTEQGLVPNN